MNYNKISIANIVFFMTIFGFSFTSCNQKEVAKIVPEYKAIQLSPQEGVLNLEFPTTLEGSQVIDIYPRVEGYLEKIYVKEGALVSKGEPLFLIDQANFQQQVLSAEAQVFAAQAQMANAQLEIEKVTPLVKQNIVSEYELTKAQSNLKAAKAQHEQAKASLEQAKINLSYTIVTAPTSGVISQINIREGALIKSSNAKPLTTISSQEEIFAYFSINEKFFFQKNVIRKDSLPVAKLRLSNDFKYEEAGKIEFASGLINATTGTVLLKATFPNSKNYLTSGMSAVVVVPIAIPNAIVVPQSATYQMLNKTMVVTINKENKTIAKNIDIVGSYDEYYIVSSGLAADDIIVIEGASKLPDNTLVKPNIQNAK